MRYQYFAGVAGLFAAAALFFGPSAATGASLGDPAPKLTVEKWVKGSPVTLGRGTNLYVVEFWATWCPPCRVSIPFLSGLQKKFAKQGVVFIGVSSEETEAVEPFVKAQGGKMDYHVGVDSTGASSRDWMQAYGQNGIPHAFVVSTSGDLVWHGYPNAELEKTIEELLAGKYDLAKAQSMEQGERALTEYRALALETNSAPQAAALGAKILSEHSRDWRVPFLLARIILTDPEINRPDSTLALKAATKAVELTRKESYVTLEIQARAWFVSGQPKAALAAQRQAVALCKDEEDLAILQKGLVRYEKAASGG